MYDCLANKTLNQQRWYVAIIIFYTGLGIVKVALLLQYRRLFAAKIQRLIDRTVGIVIVWTVIVLFMCIFTCWPIPGFWDKRIPAKCLPRYRYIIQSVGNILSDCIMFALPLPLLWRMRASLWHRLLLIMLFCLGFLYVVIATTSPKWALLSFAGNHKLTACHRYVCDRVRQDQVPSSQAEQRRFYTGKSTVLPGHSASFVPLLSWLAFLY